MVEITPEIQAQLNEQKKQCIFCKILKGEMESKKIYEDDLMVGVLDVNPACKGHALFMPKEHYPIMPYLPAQTFKHFFGKMAKMVAALKRSFISPAATIFIANGGLAGQQSPHFLIHGFPRESGDDLTNFDLPGKEVKNQEEYDMLGKNLNIMMNNHFGRNPASWRTENPQTASFNQSLDKVYEDDKALVAVPKNPSAKGHLIVYSQEQENVFEDLDEESSAHLFFTASFCATAVFEGLGAQATNIILKTGESDDNPDGRLCIHILPRFEEDGLELQWKPMAAKPDLDSIQNQIKNETFSIEQENKSNKPEANIDDILDTPNTDLLQKALSKNESGELDPLAEIELAIEEAKNG